jgi:hypothetical protein
VCVFFSSAAEISKLQQGMEGLREVLRLTNSHRQIAETNLHQTQQRLTYLEELLAAAKRQLDEARATSRVDAEAVCDVGCVWDVGSVGVCVWGGGGCVMLGACV